MDANDIKNINFISEFINEGDVLVDVGANSGNYTNFFKEKLKGTGKIYSIELHPETCSLLKNKFSNDSNIIVLNYAVSDTNNFINYFKGVDSFTHNIIGHDMNFKPNQILGQIEGVRLDTLLQKEEKISLIKIDVEGAELQVLIGLENILSKIKYLLIECHLDEHWDMIKNLLIDKYSLDCYNILTNEKIKKDSRRAYQCFCKKNN